MENSNKLKWPEGWYVPIIIFLFLFAIVFEATMTKRIGYTAWAFGAFFIMWGIYDYYRTRVAIFLWIGLLFGTGTWHALLAFEQVKPFSYATYVVHLVAVIFLFVFNWPALRSQRRLGKYAKLIFRQASENVYGNAEGFTNRPFNAGDINIDNKVIQGFAHFLNGKQIAKVVRQKDRILLAFSLGISPQSNPDMEKLSYVSFSKDGQMSVHVCSYDYNRYRRQLTFDQLCAALADLFKRFLNYYQEGKEDRILVELNDYE